MATKKRVGVTKSKAQQLIDDLVQRAKNINASEDKYTYAYKIKRLIVFGSYLTDKEKLGDIDVFYERQERWENRPEMVRYFQSKSTATNWFDKLNEDVRSFRKQLLDGHKSFSLHEIDEFKEMERLCESLHQKFIYKEIYNIEEIITPIHEEEAGRKNNR